MNASGLEEIQQTIQKLQEKSQYDFATISARKIEIRGKIYTIPLRNWEVIHYLIKHGTTEWLDMEDHLGCELTESIVIYIRKAINRVLRKAGSKFQISAASGCFSIKP